MRDMPRTCGRRGQRELACAAPGLGRFAGRERLEAPGDPESRCARAPCRCGSRRFEPHAASYELRDVDPAAVVIVHDAEEGGRAVALEAVQQEQALHVGVVEVLLQLVKKPRSQSDEGSPPIAERRVPQCRKGATI